MATNDLDKPIAVLLHRISLHDSASEDEFEKFMLDEVFPSIDTSSEGEAPDQQVLLHGGSPNEYVWMSRLEYWIHQTPFPTWLSNRVERTQELLQEKLTRFGVRTSSELYYDVRSPRPR